MEQLMNLWCTNAFKYFRMETRTLKMKRINQFEAVIEVHRFINTQEVSVDLNINQSIVVSDVPDGQYLITKPVKKYYCFNTKLSCSNVRRRIDKSADVTSA